MASEKEIAKGLGISQSYLSKGLSWFRNKGRNNLGIIEEYSKGITREPRVGHAKPKQAGIIGGKIASLSLMLRLHRFERKVPIIKLSGTLLAKAGELQKQPMTNNVQELGVWEGKGYIITTRSVILRSVELWAYRHTNIKESLMPAGEAYSDGIIKAIAQKHGIELDFTQASTQIYEIEMTDHEAARRIKEHGIIPLHYDKEGKPDVWADKSFGFGGMESNVADYLEKIQFFTNDLVDNNAWLQARGLIVESAKQNLDTSQKLNLLAGKVDKLTEQLNVHSPFLLSWQQVAEALKTPSKREKAMKAIDALKQKKLVI